MADQESKMTHNPLSFPLVVVDVKCHLLVTGKTPKCFPKEKKKNMNSC